MKAPLYSYSNSFMVVFKNATGVYETSLDSSRSQQQRLLFWLSKVRPGTWRYDLLFDSVTPSGVSIASDAFIGLLASCKAKDPHSKSHEISNSHLAEGYIVPSSAAHHIAKLREKNC